MSSSTLERIRRETDTLSETEKFALADHLLASAHGLSPEYDAFWREEVRSRIKAIDNGEEKMVPWSEAEKEFKRFEARRS